MEGNAKPERVSLKKNKAKLVKKKRKLTRNAYGEAEVKEEE